MRPVKKTRPYMAVVTPISLTRPVRARKASDSYCGRPKILTKRAPATLKRSLIMVFISALRLYASRVILASRLPTQRAGKMNTGNMRRAKTVICQLSINIATNVTPTVMALPITELKVSVNACCAPRTSLLRRDIKAPV